MQDYRSEDASTTLLELASGAQATVDCFFCIPDEASRTRLEIYGSRGAVLTEGTIGQSTGGKVEAILDLGEAGYDAAQSKDVVRKFQRIAFPAVNPYTAECSYFADCILRNQPPAINDAAECRAQHGTDRKGVRRRQERSIRPRLTITATPTLPSLEGDCHDTEE